MEITRSGGRRKRSRETQALCRVIENSVQQSSGSVKHRLGGISEIIPDTSRVVAGRVREELRLVHRKWRVGHAHGPTRGSGPIARRVHLVAG